MIALPLFGQAGTKGQALLSDPKTSEAVHNPHIAAAHVGGVDAVLGVFVGVVQVHFRRIPKIPVGLLHHTQPRRHDAEDTGGQGGIVGGHLLVVGVGFTDGLQVLFLLQNEVGQHRVRLLAHLIPVQFQGMVMQQERFVLLRDGGHVPELFLEEGIVLWIDPKLLVIGQEHRLRGLYKGLRLPVREPGPLCQPVRLPRLL